MNKNIIIFDSFSTNNFHETFNTAFLLALNQGRKESVKYFASSSAVNAIKELCKANDISSELENVCFFNLKIKKGNTSIAIFTRYFLGVFLNLKMLFNTSKNDLLILTVMNPFLVWPLQFFLTFLKRDIYIICHGELELPLKKSAIYKPTFLYKFFIYRFLKFGKINKQIKLLLLGDNIKEELVILYPKLSKEQLVVIDHPCVFAKNKQNINEKNQSITSVLSLGTVGGVSVEKGFNKLVALSEKFNSNRINFNVIGGYSFNVTPYEKLNFISKDGSQLSTQVYIDEIKKLNFVLFLFDKESYKLTVSGAILDAINLNKPVIAIKNNYFEEIFNLYGPIGYLCESVDEMAEVISDFSLENSKIEMIEFQKNLNKLKKHYSYKNIAIQLNKII